MDKGLTIEQRMIGFLETQDHVTQLDGHVHQPPNVKMADYLFFNRRAVTELKTFEVDPKEKIFTHAKPVMDSEEFPLLYGTYDLSTAIAGMPDGQAHLNRIFSKATTMVEGVLRQAKKQIASSKEFLGLDPETPGILLVLNETVDSIPVSQLVDRFNYWLRGGNDNNPSRFSHIDFVVLIQTTYRMKAEAGKFIPAFIISNDCNAYRHHKVESDIDQFLCSWAHSQGQSYGSTSDIANLSFERDEPPPPPPRTNQDFVEARYRADRHLKEMTEEEFTEHGRSVMEDMLPIVLKGAKKPSEADSMKFLKQFIELLEESRIRGFDLKKVTNRMKSDK